MSRPARASHKQRDITGKRIPVRTCVACRERRPQAELLRISRTENGLEPDEFRKLEGRGWYVCKDKLECISIKGLGKFARSDAANLVAKLELWRNNKYSGESKPAYEITITQDLRA
jgi:predicted RNA-binding protein YlxR (DUF448 family)